MDEIMQMQLNEDIETRKKVFETFKSGETVSIPLIREKCDTSYSSAFRVFENLAEDGLIKRIGNSGVLS